MTNELAIRILTGDVLGTSEQTHDAIKKAVKALSADAVSVVRCEDCASWDAEWKPIWGTERYCFTLDHITAGNFFCAYGERKKQPKTETKTDHWGYERLFCPNCKAQYTKGQRFCDNCGQKLI